MRACVRERELRERDKGVSITSQWLFVYCPSKSSILMLSFSEDEKDEVILETGEGDSSDESMSKERGYFSGAVSVYKMNSQHV